MLHNDTQTIRHCSIKSSIPRISSWASIMSERREGSDDDEPACVFAIEDEHTVLTPSAYIHRVRGGEAGSYGLFETAPVC